jgi:hypothetical protein
MQGDLAVRRARIRTRPMIEQQPRGVGVPMLAGDIKRGLADLIARIDDCAARDQQRHRVGVAGSCRAVQRRRAPVPARVHVGIALEQHLDHHDLAAPGGDVQPRVAIGCARVRIASGPEQLLDRRGIACGDSLDDSDRRLRLGRLGKCNLEYRKLSARDRRSLQERRESHSTIAHCVRCGTRVTESEPVFYHE